MPGPGAFALLSSSSFEVPARGAWSPRHDAALATVAARKLASPPIQRAVEELQRLVEEGDRGERLLGYAQVLQAQRLAAAGTTRKQYLQDFPKASPAELAALVQPVVHGVGDLVVAELLARAHHAAAQEPAAPPQQRDLPAPGAEAAAQVIQTALDSGHLWAEELLAAARALALGQTPLVPPACQLARRSPELDALAARLSDATTRTGRAVGAAFAFVRGVELDLPLVLAPPDEEFQIYMILAGPRLILLLLFRGALPSWAELVAITEVSAPAVREPDGTLELAPIAPGDRRARTRAVASLRSYLTSTLDAHLAAHPGDAEIFPELDDEQLAKIFA